FFCSSHPPPTVLYTLSLHDALPICPRGLPAKDSATPAITLETSTSGSLRTRGLPSSEATRRRGSSGTWPSNGISVPRVLDSVSRSEEHTSELQSRFDLVCRLLLEKK